MFLYLIHAIIAFILHKIILSLKPFLLTTNRQSWGGFHLFLHYSTYFKSMLIKSWVYKNFNHKFPCSSLPYIQSRPNRVCEFCLVNILPFSKWCATYILVSINDLTISMNTHFKTNVLKLNKDFFFSFLYFHVVAASYVM